MNTKARIVVVLVSIFILATASGLYWYLQIKRPNDIYFRKIMPLAQQVDSVTRDMVDTFFEFDGGEMTYGNAEDIFNKLIKQNDRLRNQATKIAPPTGSKALQKFHRELIEQFSTRLQALYVTGQYVEHGLLARTANRLAKYHEKQALEDREKYADTYYDFYLDYAKGEEDEAEEQREKKKQWEKYADSEKVSFFGKLAELDLDFVKKLQNIKKGKTR